MEISEQQRQSALDLLAFIDASPTPWHVAQAATRSASEQGFRKLEEHLPWQLEKGGAYYCVRGGSAVVAFRIGSGTPQENGYRIIGAHTDSPGFRLKPNGAHARHGFNALAVEVYGSPIIATFTDRDLTLAGRVMIREGSNLVSRLIDVKRPVVRIPNVAIHLNRDVNERGLRLDPQNELSLILCGEEKGASPEAELQKLISNHLGVMPDACIDWDLAVVDTQPGALWGLNEEFIAAPRLDNLSSTYAALCALSVVTDPSATVVVVLFDHEEVGSQSYPGADGSLLVDVLARIDGSFAPAPEDRLRAKANSLVISADMAHGLHPNFAWLSDDMHPVRLNGGPAIKRNVKQRYATDVVGAAYFRSLCDRLDISCQYYSHRNDLPCGSTIGPITAARSGIRTIDVGNPVWAMHSVRESAGVLDQAAMIAVMTAFMSDPKVPIA